MEESISNARFQSEECRSNCSHTIQNIGAPSHSFASAQHDLDHILGQPTSSFTHSFFSHTQKDMRVEILEQNSVKSSQNSQHGAAKCNDGDGNNASLSFNSLQSV